eukprot:m.122531 g.122531  ORF g.122531 m.122531 type:complete len:96 (+) comp15548_c0_seq6:863-1150(+)
MGCWLSCFDVSFARHLCVLFLGHAASSDPCIFAIDDTNWAGVLTNIDINSQLAQYAGPGGFNDPCLLLAETSDGQLRMTPQQVKPFVLFDKCFDV